MVLRYVPGLFAPIIHPIRVQLTDTVIIVLFVINSGLIIPVDGVQVILMHAITRPAKPYSQSFEIKHI